MAGRTVEFALGGDEPERLERLVDHFGGGSRAVYFRTSMKIMEGVMLAEEFRELQMYGQRTFTAEGFTIEDLPRLVAAATEENKK